MSERKSSESDPDAAVPEASGAAVEAGAAASDEPADPASDGDRSHGRSVDSSRDPAPTRRSGGKGLAVVALLVAIAALALATRPFWSGNDADDSGPTFSAADARQLDARMADQVADQVADQISGRLEQRLDALEEQQASLQVPVEDPGAAERTARVEALGSQIDELGERLDTMAEGEAQVEALTRRIGRLEGTQSSAEASLEARMAALEQRIEQRVEGLQQRLGTLGDDLEEAGRESARRLALVHARALLLQGRDRIELNGDVDAARAAWSRAAERLREAGPEASRSTQAVEALDRLVAAANSLEAVDTAGRVERLDELAAAVDDWPDRTGSGDGSDADRPAADEASDESGWRDRVGSAFGRLVRVESLDDAAPNPAEVDRARERIRTALAAAAVAAARKDDATVSVLVERAGRDVREFFDVRAGVVRQALQQLDELARRPAQPRVPAAFAVAVSAVDQGLESTR